MAQAKIYWNRENFQMVEKIFRKSVEYCNDNDTWKLNVAHVLFMQNKYKEAIGFYEPIVKKHYDNVSAQGGLLPSCSTVGTKWWQCDVSCKSWQCAFLSRWSSVTYKSVPASANHR